MAFSLTKTIALKPKSSVMDLSFAPSGAMLASARMQPPTLSPNATTVQLFELPAARRRSELAAGAMHTRVGFVSDDELLFAVKPYAEIGVEIWRCGVDKASVPERLTVIPSAVNALGSLSVSPNGRRFAISAERCSVHDSASGEMLWQDEYVAGATVPTNRLRLTSDHIASRFRAGRQGESCVLAPAHAVWLNDEEIVVVGAGSDALSVYEIASGRRLAQYFGAPPVVQGASLGNRGQHLAVVGTLPHTIRAWQTSDWSPVASVDQAFAYYDGGNVIALHPTLPELTVGWPAGLISLSLESGASAWHEASQHRSSLGRLLYSPDGGSLAAAGGLDGKIWLFRHVALT